MKEEQIIGKIWLNVLMLTAAFQFKMQHKIAAYQIVCKVSSNHVMRNKKSDIIITCTAGL